ncbi:uncharacterized protein B0H18DRAFT_52657 [Fomitopsis serialis]|uniref:uncharacterized protein n=1 Tax=Fomitopsis serialis TaxID=139415 RepID=UPI0020085A58|nr:uncharacterized protein B0H18DRAFT_52657 [Neoantrodia serialis]KAH9932288.1 hypothetical protein B0H18DRAFT_52657 [Neoantrodia serialis]
MSPSAVAAPDLAPPKIDEPKPERPAAGSRMPSLNQLAARINLNNGSNPASAASRPRLAAALLRTSSQTSMSTQASTTDSVTVNPPGSRSVSPATLSTSPPGSSSSTPAPSDAGSGEQLTTERLDKLNDETESAPRKQKMPVGYKNIPSLDAITARLAKARTLSVDGTAKPPDAETIEDPKTPGLRIQAPEHPLENKWCVSIPCVACAP